MKNARMRKCLKAAISVLACLSVAATGYAYCADCVGGDADYVAKSKK